MSIAAMTATLKKHVLERLKEQYTKTAGRTADARLANFSQYTSIDQIRSDTDSGKNRHESIMSRGAFQSLANQFTEVLTTTGISSIVSKSLNSDISFDAFTDYIKKELKFNSAAPSRTADGFSYQGATRGKKAGLTIATEIVEGGASSDRDVLILRNISIGTLKTHYANFLASKLDLSSGYTKEAASKEIAALLNSGHLTGAFNARLVRALGLRKDTSGTVHFDTEANILSTAEIEINKIMTLLTDADYLTSNLINDIGLFTATDKRLYKNKVDLLLTTEVQFGKSNQYVGGLLKQAGHAISALIKSVKESNSVVSQEIAVDKALQKLYKELTAIAALVNKQATEYIKLESVLTKEAQNHLQKVLSNTTAIQEIISSPGSRSVPEHISYIVSSNIVGSPIAESNSTATAISKLFSTTPKKRSNTPVKVKPAKVKLASVTKSTLRTTQGQFYSLTSLQMLINTHLQDVISANMGNGGERKVLNYRTGRFAASAKVERLSQSREGMITAFYSYMKNPYQTFEPGFKQGNPESRDPKLLVGKSIREIAATKVGNNLRAVRI